MQKTHYSFDKYYQIAKEYYEKNGNLLVNYLLIVTKDEEVYRLGEWIRHQRDYYLNNHLSQEHIKKLEDIGMVWNVNDYRWNMMYECLKKYCASGHDANVPASFSIEDNGQKIHLGNWINANRMKYLDNKLPQEYISLLEELGIKWKIYSEWNDVYKEAKAYFEKHHNLFMPRSYQVEIDGKMVNVSGWIHNQRRFYREGSLSQERIDLLSKIGFFDERKRNKEEKMYELLVKYHSLYGHTKVPKDYCVEEGTNKYYLGKWIVMKNNQYLKGLLDDEEITKLRKISFPFVLSSKWDIMYKLAQDYYACNGHLRVPRLYKVSFNEEEHNLGSWVATQRCYYRNGLLTNEQINMLEKIGIEWKIYRPHIDWKEAYQYAKKYYEVYGTLRVNSKKCQQIGIEYGLSSWVYNQILLYRQGRLSQEHKLLLEKIGMDWNYFDPDFAKMCVILSECVKNNKVYNIPENYHYIQNGIEYELGKWLLIQKEAFKNNKLSKKQINLLRQNDLIWLVSNETVWDTAYNYAKVFYEENHHLNFTDEYLSKIKGLDLCKWLKEQHQSLVAGTLPPNKVLSLKRIGLSYNSEEAYWMMMFNKAKGLAEKDIDINHLKDYKFGDSYLDIQKWLLYQRSNFSMLSPLKQNMLESIGFSFNLREDNWKIMFSLVEKYLQENPYQKLSTRQEVIYKNRSVNIGLWILTQKNTYRKGKLSIEKQKKLENLGIVFERKNQDDLASICLEYNIDYEKYKRKINLNTKELLLAKILWLLDNEMGLYLNHKLHPIFGMSNLNMQVIYHISNEELLDKYRESIQKKLILVNSKSE